ncbi:hypothetical protein [Clostridium butyricum]|uniref:hypothetical protein n=1 Tax=Clostridium butyricum TaxID=1492 RepID=UPI00090BA9A4|nr:hypothetical protein [Clostridium butyricum]APF21719.1 hypothetical protein NPD4_3507 [Clostridium butyricum]
MVKVEIEKGNIKECEYKGMAGEVLGELAVVIDSVISDIGSKSNKSKEYILDATVEELKKIWRHLDLEKRVDFYEFNNYEYYALIAVDKNCRDPKGIAIEEYSKQVADIEEEEKENTPDVVTGEHALERYKKSEHIEGCNTEEDKIEDFYYQISLIDTIKYNPYCILLVDGSLL